MARDFPLTSPGEFQPAQSVRTELAYFISGPGATPYPSSGDNVFYAEIVRVSFPETVGNQTLTTTQTGEFIYVLAAGHFPAEFAIKAVRQIGGYWVL